MLVVAGLAFCWNCITGLMLAGENVARVCSSTRKRLSQSRIPMSTRCVCVCACPEKYSVLAFHIRCHPPGSPLRLRSACHGLHKLMHQRRPVIYGHVVRFRILVDEIQNVCGLVEPIAIADANIALSGGRRTYANRRPSCAAI